MKVLIAEMVLGCAIFLPRAACQADSLHLETRTNAASLNFTADSIQREDPSPPLPAPYASIVHLKGNVKIRTCCVQMAAAKRKFLRKPQKQYVMMRADEADYSADTGEIEVRGHVRVNFENYGK